MSLFLDRKPRSRRFLVWKTRLFAAAVVIALVGMFLDNLYFTGTAIFLLVIGIVLRFVPERRTPPSDAAPPGSGTP